MTRRRRLSWLALTMALAGTSWCLFGFRVVRLDEGTFVVRRVFGRYTRVHGFDGAGVEVERQFAGWSNPLDGCPITMCSRMPWSAWQDDDADGRWDRWRTLRARGNGCVEENRIDTDHDGVADWIFVAEVDDYEETRAAIQARRGY